MADLYAQLRDRLPASYVAFIESHEGWEGDLGEVLDYVVIWERGTIQDRYDEYQMALYLSPQWFPFGSNGGSEMLCFDISSGTDQVYWLPYIGMSDEEPILRYNSFTTVAAAVAKGV